MRKNWQTATKEKSDYFKKCKEDGNAGIFESTAGPVIEKAAQALSEYEQMKRQIQNCQAVIYEYTSGDLSVVVEQGLLGKIESTSFCCWCVCVCVWGGGIWLHCPIML